MRTLLDKLEREGTLTGAEFAALIRGRDEALARELFRRADVRRREYYGTDVYIRGLIEFTNYCKNDCLYCGIRRSNRNARRYRLSREEILACCREGYALGYRTFVLQGGEDPWYTPERVEELVRAVKAAHPDCALTLSVGEQPRKVYQAWFDAGADRYLLRHETANDDHYRSLHPAEMSPENRKRCLWDLKDIGYQVGCGFMVGSPGQTPEHLAEDLLFLRALEPDMVGIGPFMCSSPPPPPWAPSTPGGGSWASRPGPTCACPTCLRRKYGRNTPSMTTRSARETRRPSAAAAWRRGWPPSATGWWSTVETISAKTKKSLKGKLRADPKERK